VRILHVDSARTWRGGQNQVLLTATAMAARGHEVGIVCQAGSVLEERTRGTALRVWPASFHGDLSPLAAWTVSGAREELRAQILHLHDPHALSAGLLATRLGALPGVVATRRVDFPLRGRLSRWKYRRARLVITASAAIARVLAESGVSPDRVRVVHEGVPDRPPQPGGREALAELGIPPECQVVGNVAALTDHKDHATLLEAAAQVLKALPETRFLLLGEGELRQRLEEKAHLLGLGERCLFAGFRQDLDRLIPSLSVFCLSSHLEGLGTSVLDAMAFARPVVATRAGGIPEAVEDGVTGLLVPPRDPAALSQALIRVLSDAPRREAMGAAGRRRFEEHFTADRMVDRTLAAYEELL
jgi:glycosyltransferase involved in cell wall biosynthesis